MILNPSAVAVGERHTMEVSDGLHRAQIAQYAGASGDFHPFHVDEPHAQEHGFDGVFAHGMHTMGMTGRLVSALAGDAAVRNFTAEMRRQVWPGDTLTATAEVVAIEHGEASTSITVELTTTNQSDHVVLTGTARLAICGEHTA